MLFLIQNSSEIAELDACILECLIMRERVSKNREGESLRKHCLCLCLCVLMCVCSFVCVCVFLCLC